MKPKAYLFSKGLIADPNQRGRMSAENKAHIEQAVRDGVNIDGFSVSTAAPKSVDEPVSVERVSIDPNAIVSIMPISRDETMIKANTSTGPVGMRTVCTDCKVSLTHCPCANPRVMTNDGPTPVVFTRLTKPIVANRFW